MSRDRINETGAHRALSDTASMRALHEPRTEMEHYRNTLGNYYTFPVLKMTRMELAYRCEEARVMHGLADRRRNEAVMTRLSSNPYNLRPAYRLADSDPEAHRQVIMDFISEGGQHT